MDKEMVIVLGVIGADCHAVGNKILERFFGDQGFKVVNLGVMVSQDEYIDAAIETGAEAIVVQSLYGHGEIDCQGFRDRCTERGLEGIVIHVGGNLVVGKAEPAEVRQKFLEMGFDRVVFPHDDLKEEAEALRDDIEKRRRSA
ncbi:MAG: methylaspartate mutase subunit S [Lentisphaeria bacterium]|nr:methylaspartate mutase subunit S [Lentisphaeria bacterium]